MKRGSFSPLPSERFGRLVVKAQITVRKPGKPSRRAATCICDCGNEVTVLLQNLKERTRSCGCMKLRGSMSDVFAATRGRDREFSVSPGERFGLLVVEREVKHGKRPWEAVCKCDCGQSATVMLHNLKSGCTRSCGCLQKARAAESNMLRATHALSEHEHYPRWRNMMNRCYDPLDRGYSRYGARGISVCPEWQDVAAFVAYLENILGPRPAGHSIDRIDNDGNYEPGNLRWADALTQRHNQRRYKRARQS